MSFSGVSSSYINILPVAVYDGFGIVAFAYWLRLKQLVVTMKAQSHLWLWQFVSYLRCGMLSCCICSTLVSVCARKGISIGPLAQWGKDLTYYLTSFFCLVNWDMHYPGSLVHVEGQTCLRADDFTHMPTLTDAHSGQWRIFWRRMLICASVCGIKDSFAYFRK